VVGGDVAQIESKSDSQL